MSFWGGFRGSGPKKFPETNLRLQLYIFPQKLDSMFCGLEEERTRFRKKKKKKKGKNEKKGKNVIAAKSGLVGITGYLRAYNRVKYFCRTVKWGYFEQF